MHHPSNVPDIRARELLTVVALAEYGSFVAAAAHLKTSQPALTSSAATSKCVTVGVATTAH